MEQNGSEQVLLTRDILGVMMPEEQVVYDSMYRESLQAMHQGGLENFTPGAESDAVKAVEKFRAAKQEK